MTDTTTQVELDIEALSPRFGAVIHGLGAADLADPATAQALRRAWVDYGVIFLDGLVGLGADDLARLSAAFGEPMEPAVPDQIDVAGNALIKTFDVKIPHWHADTTWMDEPPAGQVLAAQQLPSSGGDTLFASTEWAYDTLSEPIRRLCDGLTAVHDEGMNARPWHTTTGKRTVEGIGDRWAEHSVVRVHPESGRRSLWVNPMYTSHIVGVGKAESQAILGMLYEHILRPTHITRFRWELGCIAVWDNRSTWHYAVDDYDAGDRVMFRVSLRGDHPRGLADGQITDRA